MIGGSADAIAGQQFWRHKTQKRAIPNDALSIAGLHVVILACDAVAARETSFAFFNFRG
jgi:uncharacterized membrane protein YsdA (DUF1294 family)